MSVAEVRDSLIIFDGVCNLCNGAIKFIIERDSSSSFQFAPIQSEPAKNILSQLKLSSGNVDSIILIQDGKSYVKSSAALRICRRLDGLWPLLYAFLLMPRPVRDYFYDIVAKNRYQWFGRKEKCIIPTSEIENRFLK